MATHQAAKPQSAPSGATPATAPASAGAPAAMPLQLKGDNYLQHKDSVRPEGGGAYDRQREAVRPGGSSLQARAKEGTAGPGEALPHRDRIEAALGGHDLGGVRAHVGGPAAAAAQEIGAEAYAQGSDVAFQRQPDLHTAAHEAAHVVQQRHGVQLKGGVGEAGDSYEQQADAVADRVVAGRPAGDLLPQGGKTAAAEAGAPVQLLGDRLDATPKPENKPNETIAYHHRNEATGAWDRSDYQGETREYDYASGGQKTTQRKYTFGQHQAMWEQEHGRPMTETELSVLRRGCIGITVLNLGASGNPPLGEAYNTFEQGHARMQDVQKLVSEHPKMTARDLKDAGIPLGLEFAGQLGQYKAVMFAKLFWSNQKAGPDQQHFNDGKHAWNEEHIWEKKPVVLPNGLTIEQHMQQKGRADLMRYIREEVGEEPFQKLLDANHQENVAAYYLAWAKAVEKNDPEAFPIDPATGKVDMSRYQHYHGRPKIEPGAEGKEEYKGTYVNFDYGFWDEESASFWHANHCQYDKGKYGEQADMQPMIIYQSTKDKFAKGYFDFDRVIYCVGFTPNYNPEASARNHG